jgi:hypothetical protein
MFRNHRLPLTIALSALTIAGADIRYANAQSARFWKSVEHRFTPELGGLVEWLRPKWVLLEDSVREEAANLQSKLGEAKAADRAPSQPRPAALVGVQHSAAVEHRMKSVHSWFEDARPQIVADLQERANLSESDVVAIFVKNMSTAAEKPASPRIEFDPAALKIKFAYSVDIYGIRIKPSEIDLMAALEKAGVAYLGCMAAIEKDAAARSSASDSAAYAGISRRIMNCVNSTLDLLKDEIRTALSRELDAGMVARAAEKGD